MNLLLLTERSLISATTGMPENQNQHFLTEKPLSQERATQLRPESISVSNENFYIAAQLTNQPSATTNCLDIPCLAVPEAY